MIPAKHTNDSTLAHRLKVDVDHLSRHIGERNLGRYRSLNACVEWIESRFQDMSLPVERQTYEIDGLDCHNLIVELPGTSLSREIVVVGAHYDSAPGTPGANDNGTGVAALLALAAALRDMQPQRTLRWVAFVNEEPPYFQTADQMGSWVYARACRQRGEHIVAAISLETMGYYSDEPNSQHYPPPLAEQYPNTGNFIALVGNPASRHLIERVFQQFRQVGIIPVEMGCFDESLIGVGWSDHWSFWQEGYPGLMVTDTAPFRYPFYHQPDDTSDKIDFHRLAAVVECLIPVVKSLVTSSD